MLLAAALSFLAQAFACRPVLADVVELEGDTFAEGVVQTEGDEGISMLTPRGPRKFPKSAVLAVTRGISIYDIFEERRKAADGRDVQAFLRLADWADRHGHQSASRKTLEHVLVLDAANADAHGKLGHVLFEGKWHSSAAGARIQQGFRKVSGRWLGPEEFESGKSRFVQVEGEWFLAEDASLLSRGLPARFPDTDGFRVLRTPRHLVCAGTGEGDADALAALCQAAHSELEKYFGFRPDFLLPVIVFEDRGAFVEYAASHREPWMPLDRVPDGYFHPETRTVYTAFEGSKKTPDVLLHELVHQFEWGAKPQAQVPLWLREGLACFFSVHSFDGNVLKTGLLGKDSGLHYAYLRKLFREGKQWALREVLSPPGSRVADPHFYDHAWSLVYFLEKGAPASMRQGFARYRRTLYSGREGKADPAEEELLSSLGTTMEGLEKEWKRYWKGVFR